VAEKARKINKYFMFYSIRRSSALEARFDLATEAENGLPKLADSHGPKWTYEWKKVEVTEAYPPPNGPDRWRKERRRRDYGFDISVLLAAFGCLPNLNDARDANERTHWLNICRELIQAYIRTLPPDNVRDATDEWRLEMWRTDEKILHLVAARLFQWSSGEQQMLWLPILNLPPAAHNHIARLVVTFQEDRQAAAYACLKENKPTAEK
jgi:hypothetical protein